jgi:hypothetical protein
MEVCQIFNTLIGDGETVYDPNKFDKEVSALVYDVHTLPSPLFWHENAISHFAGAFKCEDCSSKKQKGKYPPRENTVRYFDKASELIEIDINKCRIFVSESASTFQEEIGFIMEDNA